ncbi:hypothetical protein AAVH_34526 [Aphelenchoides avenae]|nr:hypothetical protein AAVH_34526 [Aphelenchus avenae]
MRTAPRVFNVRIRVELGKPFSCNFAQGAYVICRNPNIPHPTLGTRDHYIFAAPGVRGWTSDGTDVIAEGARLHWDGTLEFDEFKETDLGQYKCPPQYEPDPSNGLIKYIFDASDDDHYSVAGK